MKAAARSWTRKLFPLKRWNQVEPLAVKTWLQGVMESWGKPESIRVDNGHPWGTTSSVPSALALWLAGLGVEMLYGRPAQSTDNAVIECTHRVLNRWVIPAQQVDLAALQDRLEWAVHTQRERYRSPHHLTRAQVYPDLYTNPRRYGRQVDEQEWDFSQVVDYLSAYTFERKVGKYGQVSLFGNRYSVGRHYARQRVSIQLDAHTLEWRFTNDEGQVIAHHTSRELDYDLISNLRLGKRQKLPKGRDVS